MAQAMLIVQYIKEIYPVGPCCESGAKAKKNKYIKLEIRTKFDQKDNKALKVIKKLKC
ncbi:23826_t:CDS:2 [Gigaspora margarita]|uniref:23826_t:CDS:1 n=1 Tax=Gigaspora margarita TaxID=4874 RepID=A0ABN7UTG1_GIGMA|nr:23826_t:CDS:2 [Gigaspora margarita]